MDAEEIASLVNSLKLSVETQEKAVTLTVGEAERSQKRLERVVVGKFFSKRGVNREAVRSNIPIILRLEGRTEVEMVGSNLFVVKFSRDSDKRTALEEGSWHFFSDLMLLKQTEAMQSPTDVDFSEITFWVQCHNLPFECREPSIIRRIGEKVGYVEDIDVGENGLCDGKYARIKITRKIETPLIRCVPLAHEQLNKEILIILQYEKLPNFCYACGHIGHISKHCSVMDVDISKRNFEGWLRATKVPKQQKSHTPVRTAITRINNSRSTEQKATDQGDESGNGIIAIMNKRKDVSTTPVMKLQEKQYKATRNSYWRAK